ncbi:2-vinyl bacteriochlorophyllide hydratase [Jiella sonneratiae]|uniref:2-vinyl bacteriochlorophyllide hydratase n=1 Tax=Jiella sonneratiae TaxID=2816856 RepID=A0ABS3J6V4_9HYPH|nr:2-vinyl bacteriochlorophyllide hydratase [Jiella sonneratiae]MBO0905394.1 2-vinyl bacteriochlorophyllide hydratase [Jiella sonneratiae]
MEPLRSIRSDTTAGGPARALYTPAERRRRDTTVWTLVQGILAPLQFLVCLVSLALVVRYLATSEGYEAAAVSVVVKTLALYAIMVTGSIWEKVVFGRWLFAPAFFWEDLVSMGVIALHTAYVAMLVAGLGTPGEQFAVALAGYAAYVVNAGQFVLKLRAARLAGSPVLVEPAGPAGAAA